MFRLSNLREGVIDCRILLSSHQNPAALDDLAVLELDRTNFGIQTLYFPRSVEVGVDSESFDDSGRHLVDILLCQAPVEQHNRDAGLSASRNGELQESVYNLETGTAMGSTE